MKMINFCLLIGSDWNKISAHLLALVTISKNRLMGNPLRIMLTQEAMENYVFPDEVKTKLMKMNEEHFLRPLKLCKSAASCMSFH